MEPRRGVQASSEISPSSRVLTSFAHLAKVSLATFASFTNVTERQQYKTTVTCDEMHFVFHEMFLLHKFVCIKTASLNVFALHLKASITVHPQ